MAMYVENFDVVAPELVSLQEVKKHLNLLEKSSVIKLLK